MIEGHLNYTAISTTLTDVTRSAEADRPNPTILAVSIPASTGLATLLNERQLLGVAYRPRDAVNWRKAVDGGTA
jgi:hypothetical protein